MVGIVLVSHSRPLATAAKQLVESMTGSQLPLALAAGAGGNHTELGTDATEIVDAIRSVMSDDGVLVLMDMGSALLSAEMAVDLLDEPSRSKVRFSSAPLIEGAIAAGVTAKLGRPIADVAQEAEQSLSHKQEHLKEESETAVSVPPAPEQAAETPAEFITVTLPNPHGLHARPAARFVEESAKFNADIRVENLTGKHGPVSARSLTSLATLEVLQGHQIRISARGPQAREALEALRVLVEGGMRDSLQTPPPAKPGEPKALERGRAQPIAEGIAIGPAILVEDESLDIPREMADDPASEKRKLHAALASAKADLSRQQREARNQTGDESAEIFGAQVVLLQDPDLLHRAEQRIDQEKANAARAWYTSFMELAEQYGKLGDPYLRERATDVKDVGRRVLAELGVHTGSALPGDQDGILIVDDLTPTQVSQLSGSRVPGVICLDGGRTSHSAILLRALGLPSIAQARPILEGFVKGHKVGQIAFDGATGEIWVNPDTSKLTELQSRRSAWMQERTRQLAQAREPAITTDGHRIELFANVAQRDDAEAAVRFGAKGVGLLRTEFLFLNRQAPPDEHEQIAAIAPIIEAIGQRPLVIRTLDAGGDKELPYLGLPKEANPFLGVRALRVCLRNPGLFQTQLRALLRVGVGHQVHLMFPMVSEVAEFDQAKAQLEQVHEALEREGVAHTWPVVTGIMVEVPSAVMLAEQLAARCDFFSIGTNDLTQYTLAADRGNPQLSEFQDAVHPAVLLLIRQTVEAAHTYAKRVAVCGEAASDPLAALLLVGLGVDELSMTPLAIPKIKAAIRSAKYGQLQALATGATHCATARDVRKHADKVLGVGR